MFALVQTNIMFIVTVQPNKRLCSNSKSEVIQQIFARNLHKRSKCRNLKKQVHKQMKTFFPSSYDNKCSPNSQLVSKAPSINNLPMTFMLLLNDEIMQMRFYDKEGTTNDGDEEENELFVIMEMRWLRPLRFSFFVFRCFFIGLVNE